MNTPRTDAEALKWGPYEGVPSVILPVHFARQLETELTAAESALEGAKEERDEYKAMHAKLAWCLNEADKDRLKARDETDRRVEESRNAALNEAADIAESIPLYVAPDIADAIRRLINVTVPCESTNADGRRIGGLEQCEGAQSRGADNTDSVPESPVVADPSAPIIAALQSRLDAAERDAGRYRWLRGTGNYVPSMLNNGWALGQRSHAATPAQLDRAIDAALSASAESEDKGDKK